ncbi:site-2 protease family protein [Undibacterium squillarum]|uniref:site-2 protease family protein n=1 Tax=Undibacterium squillarum TaxID=1131567 RepID=UPI0035B05615
MICKDIYCAAKSYFYRIYKNFKMIALLLTLVGLAFLHSLLTAAACRAAGVAIREVSIGTGKEILRCGLFSIRCIPFGASVSCWELQDLDEDEAALRGATLYENQPVLVRTMIILSGNLGLIVLALVLAGSEGWEAFTSGFSEFFSGALNPEVNGVQYLQSAQSYISTHSWLNYLPFVAAKVAAWNLLPLSSLNGGQMVMLLLSSSELMKKLFHKYSSIFLMVMLACWLFALFRWMSGH